MARIYLGEQIEAKAKQLEGHGAGAAPKPRTSIELLDDKAIMAQIYAFQVLWAGLNFGSSARPDT